MNEPLNDLVSKAVDYQDYRMEGQCARCESSLASKIHRTMKKLGVQMAPHTCSGQNSKAVFRLFARFKTAGSHNVLLRELLIDTEFDTSRELKKRFMSPPILALLRHGYKYNLNIGACRSQIGCTLLQELKNCARPQV